MMKLISEKEDLKEKYFASKEELDKIRSDETLLKWQVLSKAYKLGKKIWGSKFTIKKLSKDMELPYTTTKRCLSLDRATNKSWERLRKGEISAFKLAQICMSKRQGFQNDIVSAVIKDNIPTHKIKGLKIKGIKDVNEWRHKKAIEKGYSRKDSAFISFSMWVARGRRVLLLPLESYPDKKKECVIKDLKKLNKEINKFIKKNESSLH